jgi:pimeloyl-ACP methyl ester carboxylesterase
MMDLQHLTSLTITAGPDVRFTGVLHDSGNDNPLIALFPADCRPSDSYYPLIKQLAAENINTAFLAYPGCESDSDAPSNNAARTIDLTHPGKTPAPFFVMGQSIGSLHALHFVQQAADNVTGIILESPVIDLDSFLSDAGTTHTAYTLPPSVAIDPHAVLKKLDVPLLIIYGQRDEYVGALETEALHLAGIAKNKQYYIVPGATHFSIAERAGSLYVAGLTRFINQITGRNTWRDKRRKFKAAGTAS